MISIFNKKDNNLLNPDEYFDNIYKNRYKDTSFSILKGRNDGFWQIFVIDDVFHTDNVYLVDGHYSKESAINAIESGRLQKELEHQYENYKSVYQILNKK
jgi:hypothetical protein